MEDGWEEAGRYSVSSFPFLRLPAPHRSAPRWSLCLSPVSYLIHSSSPAAPFLLAMYFLFLFPLLLLSCLLLPFFLPSPLCLLILFLFPSFSSSAFSTSLPSSSYFLFPFLLFLISLFLLPQHTQAPLYLSCFVILVNIFLHTLNFRLFSSFRAMFKRSY